MQGGRNLLLKHNARQRTRAALKALKQGHLGRRWNGLRAPLRGDTGDSSLFNGCFWSEAERLLLDGRRDKAELPPACVLLSAVPNQHIL